MKDTDAMTEWLKTNEIKIIPMGVSGRTKREVTNKIKVDPPVGPNKYNSPEWLEIKRLWDIQQLMWNKNEAKNRCKQEISAFLDDLIEDIDE
jgi:hypothetical protein